MCGCQQTLTAKPSLPAKASSLALSSPTRSIQSYTDHFELPKKHSVYSFDQPQFRKSKKPIHPPVFAKMPKDNKAWTRWVEQERKDLQKRVNDLEQERVQLHSSEWKYILVVLLLPAVRLELLLVACC